MDAIYLIKKKYAELVAARNKMNFYTHEYLNISHGIEALGELLKEAEEVVKNQQPAEVLPLKGMKIRTKEEVEEFHLGLIKKMTSKVLAGCCDRVEYIKNMNQYFVTTTSLLWCSGQIEKFEGLERILNYGSLKEAKEYLDSCLHELFTQHSILSDNNDILEKELGI